MRALIIISMSFFFAFANDTYDVEEIAIIVAKTEPIEKMTVDQVREIFLKNSASNKFVAREMKEGSEERTFFMKNVLKLSESQLRDHWSSKMSKGIDKWPTKSSARSIVSFVSRGGRIGYVDAALLPTISKADDVKVILIVSKSQ